MTPDFKDLSDYAEAFGHVSMLLVNGGSVVIVARDRNAGFDDDWSLVVHDERGVKVEIRTGRAELQALARQLSAAADLDFNGKVWKSS